MPLPAGGSWPNSIATLKVVVCVDDLGLLPVLGVEDLGVVVSVLVGVVVVEPPPVEPVLVELVAELDLLTATATFVSVPGRAENGLRALPWRWALPPSVVS